VSDRSKTPIFYEDESLRLVPVECVYSVIEVKSFLDSDRLEECFENMASVRRLQKKAYSKDPPYDGFSVFEYDIPWPIWPVNYYVFAIDSIDLKTLESAMEKKFADEKAPTHSRIDTICVLNKGVICNVYEDGQIDALPGLGSRLTCISTHVLFCFFIVLSAVIFSEPKFHSFNFMTISQKYLLSSQTIKSRQ
jgi:hypothetical protein